MTICAVASCKSSNKKNDEDIISFHTFPKDPLLLRKWIQFCKRKDKWNPHTSRICSKHFKDSDYELNFQEKLMNIKRKRTLLKNCKLL